MDYITSNNMTVEALDLKRQSLRDRVETYSDLIDESRRLRRSSGISQKEIAMFSGMTQDRISSYESGKKVPRLDTYLKYLNSIGYTLKIVPKSDNKDESS